MFLRIIFAPPFSIRYCPRFFVRPSVTASSLQGIDRSCPFISQSIAYEPETCLKEGIFLGPVLGLTAVVIKLCAVALWCAVRKFEKCRENILKKSNNQVFPKIWLIFLYKSCFILFVYENMLVFHANFFKNFILQRI